MGDGAGSAFAVPTGRKPPRTNREPGPGAAHGIVTGSSPRARGAAQTATPGGTHAGTIPGVRGSGRHSLRSRSWGGGPPPIRAGSSLGQGPSRRNARGHPATRGEQPMAHDLNLTNRGHPRTRGEQVARGISPIHTRGASPHARGADGDEGPDGPQVGDTPARAGSRRGLATCRRRARGHPRTRGEQKAMRPSSCHGWGSSPRARGAVVLVISDVLGHRVIPACAGSRLRDQRVYRRECRF